jgi:type IV secretion system protein VirB5
MVKIFGSTEKTKKSPETSRSQELDPRKVSPFIAGIQEYMERYGTLSKTAARWRFISFLLSLLCALCVVSVVVMSGSVKTVPFIVQVDRHGYEIAVKPVEASAVDDRLVVSRIGRFVNNFRTVLHDDTAQVVYIDFVYKSVPSASAAYRKVVDYYKENNPLTIAAVNQTTVLVEMRSILPLGTSGKTWRAEWEEKRMSGGNLISSKSYTGIFDIQLMPPTAIREVMDNPMGIFITDLNITEDLKQ